MADRDFSRFIPPNLRQPLREAGAVGYNVLDNIIGFDNDVDTTGELLGESLRRDPFGTAKAMGSGVVEGFQEAYADPEGTVDDLIAGFQEAYARASQPLPEDATPEEIGQRTSDLFALSAAIPGVGIAGQLSAGFRARTFYHLLGALLFVEMMFLGERAQLLSARSLRHRTHHTQLVLRGWINSRTWCALVWCVQSPAGTEKARVLRFTLARLKPQNSIHLCSTACRKASP